MTTTEQRIRVKCEDLAEFLIDKNRSYGDSALNPVAIFAKGDAASLIQVRIDDKLNRIRNAPGAFGEDAIKDLIGYLILLQIAQDSSPNPKGDI